ncbi:MAG: hypothetical protein Kow006_12260 [Gammaproteobacteria bacterium]
MRFGTESSRFFPQRFPIPIHRGGKAGSENRSAGFTLIELMVVLLIIGLSVGFIVLSVSTRGDDRLAEEEARRLAALIEMAQQEAIVHNRELAVTFGRDGYRFLRLEEKKWQVISEDELLRPRELPPGIELKLTLEGDSPGIGEADEADTPHLFLLSSGERTPFEVTIRPVSGPGGYRIFGGEDEKARIERLDDDS